MGERFKVGTRVRVTGGEWGGRPTGSAGEVMFSKFDWAHVRFDRAFVGGYGEGEREYEIYNDGLEPLTDTPAESVKLCDDIRGCTNPRKAPWVFCEQHVMDHIGPTGARTAEPAPLKHKSFCQCTACCPLTVETADSDIEHFKRVAEHQFHRAAELEATAKAQSNLLTGLRSELADVKGERDQLKERLVRAEDDVRFYKSETLRLGGNLRPERGRR
jgi:hypothetical protein